MQFLLLLSTGAVAFARLTSVSVVLCVAIGSALGFVAPAAAMPEGSVFHSDFESFDSDWFSRPLAPSPDVLQLIDSARVEVRSGESYGHFDSRQKVLLSDVSAEDFSILLVMDEVGIGGASVRIAWFDGSDFLDSDRVFYIEPGTPVSGNQEFIREFSELVIPTGADRFELVGLVWEDDGYGVFDALSVAPSVSIPVPEPSSALLLGLGLAFAASRRPRDHVRRS